MKKTREQKRRQAKLKRKEEQRQRQLQMLRQQERERNRVRSKQWVKSHFSRIWKTAVAVSVVLGIVSAGLSLYPRVSVAPQSSLNPSDPFATPFAVSNDSPFTIYDVTFTCLIRDVYHAESQSIVQNTGINTEHRTALAAIAGGEKSTVICEMNAIYMIGPIATADMDIVVNYRPSFWPWHVEKRFRFKTQIASDKKLHWYPRSGSE